MSRIAATFRRLLWEEWGYTGKVWVGLGMAIALAGGGIVYQQVTNGSSDVTPPTVTLTAPTDSTTVSGTIAVSATASDDVGVSFVEFLRNGVAFDSDNSVPYSVNFDTTSVANGSHIFTARAQDAASNSTTSNAATVTVSNGGGGGTNANRWVDTNGGTCTRQSPAGPYVDAQACSSLNAAYAASGTACGDLILVKGGTYPQQEVDRVAALEGCGSDVTFRAATGETVELTRILSGNCCGLPLQTGITSPGHVTFDNFKASSGIAIEGGTHLTFNRIDGGSFYVGGGDNIIISNGDWGPCWSSTYQPLCVSNFSQNVIQSVGATSDLNGLTIVGNTIHDFHLNQDAVDDHYECVRANDGTNIVFRGNVFYDCQLYAIAIAFWQGTSIIENNFFGASCNPNNSGGVDNPICSRGSAIVNIGHTTGTFIIRFNSFGPGDGVADEGSPTGGTTTRFIIGNIFGETSCQTARATLAYNVYYGTGGATCGETGAVYYGASSPYVNGTLNSSLNYHLTGAAGSTSADNLVPTSVANSGAATDFDGQARPIGTNRDAGADER